MNLTKSFLILLSLIFSGLAFSRGGDDAGNGGFAYKQSIIILERATEELGHKIIDSDLEELKTHPEWRKILLNTLNYDALNKQPKKNAYRGGRKLAMNYQVNPPLVTILKPYYEAFMGKLDSEIEASELEVEKRLLHEASHIWGYNEADSESFALRFLNEAKADETRPTNQIEIKSDFCSCLNGKSDLIGDCDDFCKMKPVTQSPILYLNTILGPEISLNPKLGNLYNWCNVQLQGDVTAPQCFLNATDANGDDHNIPVVLNPNSNSLTANLQVLSFDKTYLLKIIEAKTGSNAQSKEFQLRRTKRIRAPEGALLVTPIAQYTCIRFGGKVDSNGNVVRDSYAREFYSFAGGETPTPMPPTRNGQSSVVCHDEQLHPGNDSIEYARLDLIPRQWIAWDKMDPRFNFSGQKLKINSVIEERMLEEYGVQANIDLFSLIHYPARPATAASGNYSPPLGYIMKPFVSETGESYCPMEDSDGNVPLFQILKEYMGNTEALYIAEKEAEIISDGNMEKTIYATMFATETMINKYGFYIENGVKIRATPSSLSKKTIFYYWPYSDVQDPLLKGNRKLFTVRSFDQLNGGNMPDGIGFPRTSDKRIGCIPKGAL